ncbi:tetratricopeptide repeat protein [Micromonospora pisi]|uniref:Tetratricopeptide repeat protein n=1 Tax=Micromonospora pisi TaxID=589240 RepID=A0A495JF49_9ACTN|nr:tetratricopeptide repeat protein [Micromonospora pisi]RKR87351.1 tetratricopeptide repeat protein [Micromonospora pisi]
MAPLRNPVDSFTVLPDPGRAETLDGLVEQLRLLKIWAGDPSYESITSRVNSAWVAAGRPAGELARKSTVADCFRPSRRRLNNDLVIGVVQALHPDQGYLAQWRQALQVVGGKAQAASQVRVQDTLPQDLPEFTGRTTELERLRQALRHGQHDGGAVVVSAIEGMAGVGKTQLVIHAGHLLAREQPFDRVLFVNLRGFHPDPAQPPAEPSAVLDGFLRLLGVPAQNIPHDLEARAAAYRDRLAGTRALVVLDNAASTGQVRPLLPGTPGCLTLVTSRRNLTELRPATHLTVDVFTPDEAVAFLGPAVREVPVGEDPDALTRIARRCGHLPLALGLVAGHIRGRPGWTLTDHADRLDELHHGRRLESGVELALSLSYQRLSPERRRLLRLAALHPGQDFDAYAAAALSDTDLPAGRAQLDQLGRDHLLQESAPGRYTFHDLVRTFALSRASDEDPPSERRAALSRLFDHYVAAAATAMDTLHPAEAHRRPRIAAGGTLCPAMPDPEAARSWLDTELHTLVAVAAHAAIHGWPSHTVRLSTTLFRYLAGGHFSEALTIHGHARHAAQLDDDRAGQAHALVNLATVHGQLGQHGPAAEQLQQALGLFERLGDPTGQARAVGNLGAVEQRLGRYRSAAHHLEQALVLERQAGNQTGEVYTLLNLGVVEERLGHYQRAADHYEQALTLGRRTGDRTAEAAALTHLGDAEVRLGRPEAATEHLRQALVLYRQLGYRNGEAWTLDSFGTLHAHLGQPAQATEHHGKALAIFREIADRDGESLALNGLGEAAHAAGRAADAVDHHTAARSIAAGVGALDQQARAHAGLAHAHRTLGEHAHAHEHFQQALTCYTTLGMPQAEQIRAHLTSKEPRLNSGR